MPEEPERRSVRADIRWGVELGLVMAAGLVMLAAIPALVWALTSEGTLVQRVLFYLGILGLYPAAGVIGGAVVGSMRPLLRFWIVRRMAGILVMIPFTAGLALMINRPGEPPRREILPWVLAAVVLGVAFSFVFEEDARRTWRPASRRMRRWHRRM